jgi:cytochrome c-type biogenesis protein CcmF
MLQLVTVMALAGSLITQRWNAACQKRRYWQRGASFCGRGFLFLLLSSNPFERLHFVGGMGLNPLLQDVGLVFHPPRTLDICYCRWRLASQLVRCLPGGDA